MDARTGNSAATRASEELVFFFVVDSLKLNMSFDGECGEYAITVNCIITINATI